METLARRGEDRVRHGGRDGRDAGLTDPSRRLHRSDDVDLDLRHIADAKRLVAIEVGLFDKTISQRDRVAERRT